MVQNCYKFACHLFKRKPLLYKKLFLFNMKKNLILSRRGTLTVQFVLGFALILGFVGLFWIMTFTLAMSSITQYITFASARNLFLSTENKPEQRAKAQQTYDNLKAKFSSPPFFGDDTIEIFPDIRNSIGLNRQFSSGGPPNLFYGVWTGFKPKILTLKPYFGDVGEDASFFTTTIGSYLGREPTVQECKAFDRGRWPAIKAVFESSPRSPGLPSITVPPFTIFDNGC